jgi:XTP/dITP diphosphohydrolase
MSLAFAIMPRVTILFLATRNAHKAGEICAILGGQFQLLTLNDFPGAPKVVEDADTFAGNATKKSVELARWVQSSGFKVPGSGFFVLADDSGLEVDALDGAPGVHSARFAAVNSEKNENSSDAENNAKLLRLLENIPAEKRTARFHCILALTPVPLIESQTQLFDGVCEGKIIFEPHGKNGFGYDPLFVPNGFVQTFAELDENVKNKLSHRAKALETLKNYFNKSPS